MWGMRRRFTDEFKREAVRLCSQPGAVVTQVAKNLGGDQSMLRRWVQLERGGAMEMNPARPLRAEALGEVQRLQREPWGDDGARDPKKALGYFAKDPQ